MLIITIIIIIIIYNNIKKVAQCRLNFQITVQLKRHDVRVYNLVWSVSDQGSLKTENFVEIKQSFGYF